MEWLRGICEMVNGMDIDTLYIVGSIMLICIFLLAEVIVIWGLGKDNEELGDRVEKLEEVIKNEGRNEAKNEAKNEC